MRIVRGSKNGYYKANNDGDYGEMPSSYSTPSRKNDVRRPLLLDIQEWEHSKCHTDGGDMKRKTKKVAAKKISPPSPSQRSIKRGVVARRIDAIESGLEYDDDDDDSRYLLSSIELENVRNAHTPKKSLLSRLGSPRDNKTFIFATATSSFSGKRILQQNEYHRTEEDMNDDEAFEVEVLDLGGFDVLGNKKELQDNIVTSPSSDKENDENSLTSSSSTIDLDGQMPIEEQATGDLQCEIDAVNADTILADLVETAMPSATTPSIDANLVVAGEKIPIHTPIDVDELTNTTDIKQPNSCVTHATMNSTYHCINDQEKPFHVTVTPTEDGDVILLSASKVPPPPSPHHTASMDSTLRKESVLSIPSLGGREEDDESDDNNNVEYIYGEEEKVLIEEEVQVDIKGCEEEKDERDVEVPTNVNVTPVEPESRKKIMSTSNKEKETSSPTGVDELDMYQEEETSIQEIGRITSDDFTANENWDNDDDTITQSSSLSRPFGSFEIHEDAMREVRRVITLRRLKQQMQEQEEEKQKQKEQQQQQQILLLQQQQEEQEVQGHQQHQEQQQQVQQHHVIELRHSMESDCDDDSESQSSSSYLDGTDLLGSDTQSIELKTVPEEADDEAEKGEEEIRVEVTVDDESQDCRATGTSLGSFSQIYKKEGQLPDDEESDSECDEPAECSDQYAEGDTSENCMKIGGAADEEFLAPIEDGIDQKSSLSHFGCIKPWALAECDSESVYSGADLISVPSKTSLTSNDDQENLAPSSSMLSADPHSVSTGDRDNENFESLNTFWVREWTDAVTKLTAEADSKSNDAISCKKSTEVVSGLRDTISCNEGLSDITCEPRLLLKKDVGDTMSDDNNEQTGDNGNICTDGDGNQYLKIYDIDSCTNMYEVIQFSGQELETVVEECISDEDAEGEITGMNTVKNQCEKSLLLERLLEDSVESEMQKLVASQSKEHETVAPSLEELQKMFDIYQAAQGNQFKASVLTPLSPLTQAPFRIVKSTKKRHVHIKRRAVVKAKAEKTKYDLVYVEKGSHREKGPHRDNASHTRVHSEESVEFETYSNVSHSSLGSSMSLDGIISKAVKTVPEFSLKEGDCDLSIHCDVSKMEEDQSGGQVIHTIEEETSQSSSVSFDYCAHCDIPNMEEEQSGAQLMGTIDEEYSLGLGSNMSLDGIISKAIRTMPEFLFEDKVPVHCDVPKMELGDAIEEEISHASSVSFESFAPESDGRSLKVDDNNCDHVTELDETTNIMKGQPEVVEGTTSVLAKLYDENNELAESLAAVQRELENVNRKLAIVTHERDEVISSARIEV
ncbi:hypothetical protein ACHAXH_007667 [Discostella pseudostelligera]